MKRNLRKFYFLLVLISIVSLVVLAACGDAVPRAEYDELARAHEDARLTIERLNAQVGGLNTQLRASEQQLDKSRVRIGELEAQVKQLEGQIASLEEKYDLTGATAAETAAKIVAYYHDTHVYSVYDLFVCSDMAADVWNMLKARDIRAVIAVGDINRPIADIVLSNHAWVLAEVAPREYLALETTGGRVVTRAENPLYYRGWSFDSPADLKEYKQKIWEYNVRVGLHNELVAEDKRIVTEHNQTEDPLQAARLEAVHDELSNLILAQEEVLDDLLEEINRLARVIR